MTQNGDQKLESLVEEKLLEIQNNTPFKFKISKDYEKYFELDLLELRKLSGEDCEEGAFLLAQLSLYLQSNISENKAAIFWLNENINYLKGSETAMKLRKEKVKLQVYNTSIEDCIPKIDYLAKTLASLAFSRRKL